MASHAPAVSRLVARASAHLLRPVDDVGPQTRHLRRLITGLVAVAACFTCPFLAVIVQAMVQATGRWWYWILLLTLLAPPVLAGTLGEIARRRQSIAADRWAQRTLLATLAVFAVVVVVACGAPVITFYDQEHTVVPQPNLLVNYGVIVAITCAAALRQRAGLAFTLVMIPLTVLSYPDTTPLGTRIEEIIVYLAGHLGDLAVLNWLLVQAEGLDAADSEGRTQRVRLRIQESLTRSREESNHFIHDHILSVLKAIPMLPKDSPILRAAAHEALDSFTKSTPAAPVRPKEIASALHRSITTLAGPPVSMATAVAADLPVPGEAARALLEAAHEALRNSLTHAGGDAVARRVTVEATEHAVVVTVADDGSGFDPEALPAGHLGIRHSVLETMERVGGRAMIDSAAGTGTTVTLSYAYGTAMQDPQTPEEVQGRPASPLTLISCMEHPLVRAVTGVICAAYLFVVCNEIRTGAYHHGLPVLVALGLDVTVSVGLLWSWPGYRLPGWGAGAAVLIIVGANTLVMNQIALEEYPGYASWSIGVSTFLACSLLMRNRPGFAWSVILLVVLTTTAWAVRTGHSPWVAISIGMGQIVPCSVWHLMVRLSLHLTARTAKTQADSADIVARQHAQRESQTLMSRRMDSVRSRVTPLLTAITDDTPPTDDLCTRARLLEAELRDEIRAPFFTGTPVASAARTARARGASVTLLDDHSPAPLSPSAQRVAVEQAAAALQSATTGRVLIRLLPPHRHPDVMTITTDNGTTTDIRTVRASEP